MEKIVTMPKMSKINLDSMFFEIILSMKGDSFRARSSSIAQINNVNETRPEATSKISYENAIQKLIPKIEKALVGTNKNLGKVYLEKDGRIFYTVENILYENQQSNIVINNSINNIIGTLINTLTTTISSLQSNGLNVGQIENVLSNNISNIKDNINAIPITQTNITELNNSNIITFQDLCVKWLQALYVRTKKTHDDEDYLSPSTLEGYNRILRESLFPFLEKNPQYDNISTFTEQVVDELLSQINCRDSKRILLVALRLIFDYAKQEGLVLINPLANKKLKRKKKVNKDYDFIEEEDRAIWINCMIKEIQSIDFDYTDAALAFLCTLLHGNRPEETCGTKWKDFNFKEDDYHIQNAYKKIPIYDEKTMKRIGWKKGDGPLKTPESDRHLSLDPLFKQLLLVHRVKQMYKFRKEGKKWSENEYVFYNSTGTPFTPDILSKNFNKFIKRNGLPHIVIYGLRHSFATHCRNLGMKPEVLARLMGHTEYQTTQKYYIHISKKQKKEALQGVQKQDMKSYLGNENKNLTHLQNNINKNNKNVSNLEEVQKDDLKSYLQLNDDTLKLLKQLITKISEKEKIYT